VTGWPIYVIVFLSRKTSMNRGGRLARDGEPYSICQSW
jgi:hypothetical protein